MRVIAGEYKGRKLQPPADNSVRPTTDKVRAIESAEFVIYIINFLAHSLKKYPSEIYKVLESTNCINEYLVPFYDVLHTMGTEMIAEDVKKFVKNRGSSL